MPEHDEAVRRLVAAVAADDLPGLVSALAPLSEAARRVAWRALGGSPRGAPADVLVAVGCAPGVSTTVEAAWTPGFPPSDEHWIARVLADRRPHWLPALAQRLLSRRTAPGWGFRVVRLLVRGEVLERPAYPEYAEAMVNGLVPWRPRDDDGPTVLDALREDPALLDDELWRLLGEERSGRALHGYDQWRDSAWQNPARPPHTPAPWATWRHALVTLAAEGAVSRDRLLDAALRAMLADRAAADLTWYVSLLDAVAPTDREIAARGDVYLRLLASDAGPVVRIGLDAARRLLDSRAAAAGAVVQAVAPVLGRPQKGTALAALGLLRHAGRADDVDRASILAAALPALEHPNADVRDRARALLTAWGAAPAPQPGADVSLVARASLPPLDDAGPVSPIGDPDELAEVFAHLIEEADDSIEVERALDGVARLASAMPRHGAQALVRRALDVASTFPGAWFGGGLRADLAAIVLWWLDGRAPVREHPGRVVGHRARSSFSGSSFTSTEVRRADWTLTTLVSRRIHELVRSSRGGGEALLSLPVTTDGSVTSSALNARLAAAHGVRRLDLGLAILRVPPAELDDVRLPLRTRERRLAKDSLATLGEYRPAWARIVAGGADQWERPIDPMVLWADPHSARGDADRLVPAVLDRRDPARLAGLEASDGEHDSRPEQVTALWPLMLPHHVDLLAAHSHPRLARALVKDRSGAAPLVRAIGLRTGVAAAPTWSALALAMAAQEPPVRTVAVDAFVARARRGLLDAPGLAEQVRLSLADDVVVGTRIADALAEAARADAASATAVLAVLADVAPALPGRRDAHRWIDVLADLSQTLRRPVALPPDLRALAASSETTALARACRRVLSR